MSGEEYLDSLGKPLVGERLYKKGGENVYLVLKSRPSNVNPVWYA